jgi:two-component system sensor histidine kinase KdpD
MSLPRSVTPYALALIGVAAVAGLTSAFLPVLGLASSALLFLLPVLYGAARGGIGPGLIAALAGAGAYNYFLLPPRFTFRVHHLDNLVSVFVLVAVALVTSRLATRLMAREAEALERARASGEEAELSAMLFRSPSQAALAAGIEWFARHYGDMRTLREGELPAVDAAFSSIDLSAAAWALHNGDVTGHGTGIMPAADWTFLPLAPKSWREGQVAALARPSDGRVRSPRELDHLAQLAILLGQSRDRQALEAERQQRQRLEEADNLRRTFLASLAHDFRTPLTVIAGRLAMLAQANPDARDALDAAQRLDRMMTDLVEAARIEAGPLAPAMESVDLVDAAGAALDAMEVPQGIAIRRNISADLPFVFADPVMLHHVVINLVDNALRHAAGSVELAARPEGEAVILRVIDDGPGIPLADRARIFERFVRIEGSDRVSGSGLGLAIVKGFVDAMGMTIRIEDGSDGGSCFALTMPIAPVAGT